MEEIILQPNPLEIAESIEGEMTIGGGETQTGTSLGFNPLDFNYSSSDYDINASSRTIRRISNGFNPVVIGRPEIPRNQGWTVEASNGFGNVNEYFLIGVKDNNGIFTGFTFFADDQFNLYTLQTAFNGSTVSTVNIADGITVRILSDGTKIDLYRRLGANYILAYSAPLPSEVLYYKWFFQASIINTTIYSCLVGSDTSFIPFSWNNVSHYVHPPENVETRIISPSKLGIKVFDGQSRVIQAYTPTKSTIANINVSPMYLRPIPATQFAVSGEVIQFETNGGASGIFEASIGTIVDTLKWLAPDSRDTAHLTYTVGVSSASYDLEVVPKLEIEGVENGYYKEILAQGEQVQFGTTIPETVFTTVNVPNQFITPDGLFTAPTDAKDEFFGAKVVTVSAEAFGQTILFKVRIYPMYPTPEFCGAKALYWRQDRPDKLPIIGTTIGGKREVKNQNKNGVIRFILEYKLLPQNATTGCCCGNEDCSDLYATAKRLDDFYKLYGFDYRFTVVDKHTKELFKGVQMTKYENDHIDYAVNQIREVELYFDGGEIILDYVEIPPIATIGGIDGGSSLTNILELLDGEFADTENPNIVSGGQADTVFV